MRRKVICENKYRMERKILLQIVVITNIWRLRNSSNGNLDTYYETLTMEVSNADERHVCKMDVYSTRQSLFPHIRLSIFHKSCQS
mmetsp:Transcript_25247/g.36189  ORF Transcript_25247/g.36189 Transcript_25247/m.36189 type:complete len:85 (+) Transcript_25247:259-513(+)